MCVIGDYKDFHILLCYKFELIVQPNNPDMKKNSFAVAEKNSD